MAPKLIMLIMMLSPPFLTALGVVREGIGSIFNIYSSTVSPGEFLLASWRLMAIIRCQPVHPVDAVLGVQVPSSGRPGFFTTLASRLT